MTPIVDCNGRLPPHPAYHGPDNREQTRRRPPICVGSGQRPPQRQLGCCSCRRWSPLLDCRPRLVTRAATTLGCTTQSPILQDGPPPPRPSLGWLRRRLGSSVGTPAASHPWLDRGHLPSQHRGCRRGGIAIGCPSPKPRLLASLCWLLPPLWTEDRAAVLSHPYSAACGDALAESSDPTLGPLARCGRWSALVGGHHHHPLGPVVVVPWLLWAPAPGRPARGGRPGLCVAHVAQGVPPFVPPDWWRGVVPLPGKGGLCPPPSLAGGFFYTVGGGGGGGGVRRGRRGGPDGRGASSDLILWPAVQLCPIFRVTVAVAAARRPGPCRRGWWWSDAAAGRPPPLGPSSAHPLACGGGARAPLCRMHRGCGA